MRFPALLASFLWIFFLLMAIDQIIQINLVFYLLNLLALSIFVPVKAGGKSYLPTFLVCFPLLFVIYPFTLGPMSKYLIKNCILYWRQIGKSRGRTCWLWTRLSWSWSWWRTSATTSTSAASVIRYFRDAKPKTGVTDTQRLKTFKKSNG